MAGSRWCPICKGVKRPSEPICMACGITRKTRGCGCACCTGGFCGGCGHAGCGRR